MATETEKKYKDTIDALLEENRELERSNEMFRNICRGVASALGLKQGDSWHDMPDRVRAHIDRIDELSNYLDGANNDAKAAWGMYHEAAKLLIQIARLSEKYSNKEHEE